MNNVMHNSSFIIITIIYFYLLSFFTVTYYDFIIWIKFTTHYYFLKNWEIIEIAEIILKCIPGLQSVNREQIDNSTLEIVNAGDQLSFNISKQITPWELILQW